MGSMAFTVTIPAERIQEFRDLMTRLKEDPSGLAERARAVGYHRERMWLQPNPDGSAQLITYLETDNGVDPAELGARLRAYESDFTRWWSPRYVSLLGGHPPASETMFAWDHEES